MEHCRYFDLNNITYNSYALAVYILEKEIRNFRAITIIFSQKTLYEI